MSVRRGFRCSKCGATCLSTTSVQGWTCFDCQDGVMEVDTGVRGGHLDSRTPWGSYPIVYYLGEELLCSGCAARERDMADPEEPVKLLVDVYYEGPTLRCGACEKELPSAYGDPENPEGEDK